MDRRAGGHRQLPLQPGRHLGGQVEELAYGTQRHYLGKRKCESTLKSALLCAKIAKIFTFAFGQVGGG